MRPPHTATATGGARETAARWGITWKIAMLSWLVTLGTLVVFVAVIIPAQREVFRENLHSKAVGLSASIKSAEAGALVADDKEKVVEYCLELLKADKAIEYLVITKNGGSSLIHEPGKWTAEELDANWFPAVRTVRSRIEVAPYFGRRVYACSDPLDYSGVPWGWIHVGLSLNSYDQSMADLTRRTVLIAVCCVVLGGVVSYFYVRRMMRPILALRDAVNQVARGNLSARAAVGGQDEVGSLAQSFNQMTEGLLGRDDILQSVRFAAEKFLAGGEWQTVMPEVLAHLGEAARLSRIYLFINQVDAGGKCRCQSWHSWVAADEQEDDCGARVGGFSWATEGLRELAQSLDRGDSVALRVRQLSPAQRIFVDARIKSFFATPIHVQGLWWGTLRFDLCQSERMWSHAERHSFRTIAGMLGAAIARQNAQQALLEAKATLEVRVRERTRELEDQVAAAERARAELAETQQRLMDISRQAGMAEVATGVLHNVGNVLNSVNVSASLIAERARQSRAPNLLSLVELMEQHQQDLQAFLAHDPKGQRVLNYLRKLAQVFQEESRTLQDESEALTRNVEHIKEIVAVQQNYAKVSGVMEQFSMAALVEDAIEITQTGLQRHHVKLHLNFEPVPEMLTDKHKVLQILLNLLRNAQQAVAASGHPDRNIHISIRPLADARVRIQVRDDGIGIRLEDLARIFSHGFTTKRDGHGFGLHLGALTAQQLGGALTAESQGVGRGATFTLELPLRPQSISSDAVASL